MKVKMRHTLGTGSFGRWPQAGEVGDVPDAEARWAIANNHAVEVDGVPVERSTARPDEKRTTAARRKKVDND